MGIPGPSSRGIGGAAERDYRPRPRLIPSIRRIDNTREEIRRPMSRLRALVILAAGVLIGAAADRQYRLSRGPHGELAHMAHVGILVRNLDEAVAKFKAMGFDGIN